jgi:hypothetical protein
MLASDTLPLTMVAERREYQRMQLAKPILAMLDGQNALLLDIGVGGAFIEHYGTIEPGKRFRLLFRWKGDDVEFICQVGRSAVIRGYGESTVSHTGAEFVEFIGDSEARLQDMMLTFVGRVLAAQKTNAFGVAVDEDQALLGHLGEARRSRSRGYLAYYFEGVGAWTRTPTNSPAQPNNGFTVGAFENEEDLETLCRAYEIGDDEARRLIRLVAEMSARNVKKS